MEEVKTLVGRRKTEF